MSTAFFPFGPPAPVAVTAQERFENVVTAMLLIRENPEDCFSGIWENDREAWPVVATDSLWLSGVMRWFEPAFHPRMEREAVLCAAYLREEYEWDVSGPNPAVAVRTINRIANGLIDERYRDFGNLDFLPAFDLANYQDDYRVYRWAEVTGRLIYCGGRSIHAKFNASPWVNLYADLPRPERLQRYEKHILGMPDTTERLASLQGKLPALWRDGESDEADVLHDLLKHAQGVL
ncbi:hypothetical protein [Mesorhizobium sp. IMUNJ 23232]|uniref:hypothetical protein n=1 Tax=Mesorhizobium sp. IMUNJ 23232 TaxID=3376064 RepID=UPI0037BBD63A